jgi:hypothetical protein
MERAASSRSSAAEAVLKLGEELLAAWWRRWSRNWRAGEPLAAFGAYSFLSEHVRR